MAMVEKDALVFKKGLKGTAPAIDSLPATQSPK
jgi:hypothetical protein